jgi:cytochrome P450 RapN
VLADPRFSRAAALGKDVPRLLPAIPTNRTIDTMDPPDHTRLRRLVSHAFTTRRVERLRPRVQEIAADLLGRMADQGPPADLVQALAFPLPITVICELLGVPSQDQDRFSRWADALRTFGAFAQEEVDQAREELNGYLVDMVAWRREQPTDDLISALVTARDDQDRLSEQELISISGTLLMAGYDTTAHAIANYAYTLLTHPRQLALLRAHPDLLPKAIEELLRITPLGIAGDSVRIATEDVQVADVLVRSGEAVVARGPSGNRDRSVFTNPDQLDITRAPNPHLTFGYGIHRCLGASLARMELQVALGSLLARFPYLGLAVPVEEVTWKHDKLLRGPRVLPVTW